MFRKGGGDPANMIYTAYTAQACIKIIYFVCPYRECLLCEEPAAMHVSSPFEWPAHYAKLCSEVLKPH